MPKAVFFRTVVFAGMICLVSPLISRRAEWNARSPITFTLLGFLLVAIIASVAGVAPFRSFYGDFDRMWGVFAWMHLVGFYVLLRTAFAGSHWRRYLSGTMLVGAAVTAIGLLEAYGYLFPTLRIGNVLGQPGYRASSTLGNPGYLSGYLLLVGAITLSKMVAARSAVVRAALLGLLGAEVWLFLSTGGRAALIGLGLAVTLAAAVWMWHAQTRTRLAVLGAGPAIVAILLVAAVSTGYWQSIPTLNRIVSFSNFEDVRFEVWKGGLRAAWERPVLGSGLENANVALNAVLSPDLFDSSGARRVFWDRIHNVFLEVLVATGVPGLLFYVGIWLFTFMLIASAVRRRLLARSMALCLAGGLLAYLVHLSFWFEDWNSFPIALAVAAFAEYRWAGPLLQFGPTRERPPERPRLLIGAAVAIWAVTTFLWAVQPLRSTWHAEQALEASSTESRIAQWERAVELAGVQRLQFLFEMTLALRNTPKDTESERAAVQSGVATGVDRLSEEIARDPRNDLLYASRADLYRIWLELTPSGILYGLAVEDLNAAIRLAPIRMSNYHGLADLHIVMSTPEAALEISEEACAVRCDFAATHQIRTRALLDLGKPEDAFQSALAAVRAPDASGNPDFVIGAANAFGRAERNDLARALIHERLLLQLQPGADGLESRRRFSVADRELAARLPLEYLRAGDEDEARRAADTLRRGALDAAPAVDSFLRSLDLGRARHWALLGSIPLADWRP